MAPKKGSDLKLFYAAKKGSKSEKKRSSAKSKSADEATPSTASLFSPSTQPAALPNDRPGDDHDAIENILKQFDMDMKYGPCIGVSRRDRWERAFKFGLNPPENVKLILESADSSSECLWEGRV
eukprot:TRINITY_DN15941_c0_g1_i2.p1 TRINITY_DN15941_c0_g1~~TRINITY_DN15941_c0_g1_i2.p1  ORF type:complete len:124 (+),score=28.39 TRINITY_DN15941_c0_g1_i2:105-476(+)